MPQEKQLNSQQIEAVKHERGPLLIIAGAGTGKTTVITERVKHLVTENLAQPSEILALTFTEKAAQEMETRIDEALPLGYSTMWVMTFHGFCDRILRDSAIHIGLDPAYRLMTTAESIDLLTKNLFELGLNYFRPLGNPTKFLFGLLNHFSRLQDENISPEEYLVWAKNKVQNKYENDEDRLEVEKFLELATAYQKFDELKIKNSLMDFGDVIVKTILLFKSRPNILKEYKSKFKYILVDEFQDTNFSQNELVKMLAGKTGNITVVADDDQSIYRFRGAAVSNVLAFRKNFENVKIVTLTQNYRSFQKILDRAHDLIEHNNPDRLEVLEKIDKKLVASQKGAGVVEFSLSQSSEDEADFVAEKIIELSKQYSFKDFAILVRANNHASAFIDSLTKAGVPHQFLGPGKLFEQPEITQLISYLKVIVNVHDSQALYELLVSPHLQIDPTDIARVSSFARKSNDTLFETLVENSEELSISNDSRENLQLFLNGVTSDIAKVPTQKAGEVLYEYMKRIGILENLLTSHGPEAEARAQNIAKFFAKLRAYETNMPKAKSREVLDWLVLQMDLGESPAAAEIDWSDEDSVKIMTVHSSKGLEFPVVFLVNLVSLRFPGTDRKEQIPIPDDLIAETLPSGDFHLQEERRLFYVGMTRAKHNLYLTAAKFYGDAKREKKVSQFVTEALGSDANAVKSTKRVIDESPKQVQKPNKENISPLIISYLSYSQIETFKMCPLHYKLHYIMNFPSAPTAAQSFGTSFHATLKQLYLDTSKIEDVVARETLLKNNWIREGYLSKAHEKQMFERAKNFLADFSVKLFDPTSTTLGVETPFAIKFDGLKIGGIIDRIDKTKNGIEIIDYKTGAHLMTQKEADESLQLSIYALAATKIYEKPFGLTSDCVDLTLIYFEPFTVLKTKRTQKQLDEAQNEIFEWKRKIETSDFSCSGNFLCQNCEYSQFCLQSAASKQL
jgi:DNA helicase-2/ATP-dependent DNA helicase PcrA